VDNPVDVWGDKTRSASPETVDLQARHEY
jgi:hypothetical protein